MITDVLILDSSTPRYDNGNFTHRDTSLVFRVHTTTDYYSLSMEKHSYKYDRQPTLLRLRVPMNEHAFKYM